MLQYFNARFRIFYLFVCFRIGKQQVMKCKHLPIGINNIFRSGISATKAPINPFLFYITMEGMRQQRTTGIPYKQGFSIFFEKTQNYPQCVHPKNSGQLVI